MSSMTLRAMFARQAASSNHDTASDTAAASSAASVNELDSEYITTLSTASRAGSK